MEKFLESTEQFGYRCTTTNHSACNDTIIVLIIILLHSVYIITNFVITKRDKQTKNNLFLSTAGARPTIPTILGMVIDEVRPVLAPLTFVHLISSFAARVYLKIWGKMPPLWENAEKATKFWVTWLLVPWKFVHVLTSDAYKIWEFHKNCANEWPLRGKFMTKNRNFDSFGGCIPTFLHH